MKALSKFGGCIVLDCLGYKGQTTNFNISREVLHIIKNSEALLNPGTEMRSGVCLYFHFWALILYVY